MGPKNIAAAILEEKYIGNRCYEQNVQFFEIEKLSKTSFKIFNFEDGVLILTCHSLIGVKLLKKIYQKYDKPLAIESREY